LSEVPKLAHSACSLFQQHGSPESAVNVLDKAAKMLEATQPQQALEMFRRAADILTVGHLQVKLIVTSCCTKIINNYKIVKNLIIWREKRLFKI